MAAELLVTQHEVAALHPRQARILNRERGRYDLAIADFEQCLVAWDASEHTTSVAIRSLCSRRRRGCVVVVTRHVAR
jgi:hypothetical protein